MSNIAQRLLLFFVGVPLLVAAIVLLPWANHAAIVLVVLAFVGGSAFELGNLFRQRGIVLPSWLFVATSLVAPIAAYVGSLLGAADSPLFAAGIAALVASASLVVLFSPFALSRRDELESALTKAASLGFTAIYPGILSSFIVLIASEPVRATESILCFSILVFGNDSLAWLFGMALGRKRGIVAASPNKSMAGFIAGLAGSMGLALLCPLVFPDSLRTPWWAMLLLGAGIGIAGIFGDLFESALKRSAGAKDSGRSILGRGGFLDCFDSLLFAAPLFYGSTLLLGLFR
jgi:phosphatidate cytidylyltransferase